jgi:uncharacterized membrane protein YidH (DUF202 family)
MHNTHTAKIKLIKINYMTNQKKTNIPLVICIIGFVLGMIIAAWGWDKNESTIPERTHGAVAMIWTGCIMIAGGLLGMAAIGGRTKSK